VAATSRASPDEVGSEDLADPGSRAQPGRFDNRIAVVVPLLLRGLSSAQTHTQSQRLLDSRIMPMNGLLHRHRTSEGC
jgi:hypothetical protein